MRNKTRWYILFYIDLDDKGNLVSMTIEHVRDNASISEVSYLQMEKALITSRFTGSPGNPAPDEL